MELLLILFFATNLFHLTKGKHVKDYEEEEDDDDIFELPPDPNPVAGFAQGPLPEFIELNLHVKYDVTLLEWFGGSKEAAENYLQARNYLRELFLRIIFENYLQAVIKLARPYLEKTNLDIKIHTKVAPVIHIT